MASMKAVVLKGFGGGEVLSMGEVPQPSPGNGQVRIRVMATSVNRADIVQRQGNYPPPPGESETLGLEVAGTVDAVGPGVTGHQIGDRVMSLVGGGGYAAHALAWAEHLIPIPASMDFVQAAGVCETYITAFLNVFRIGGLSDGERVLLHGGGGGVNTAAVQLCRMLVPNAVLFVTASPAKLDRVASLGVHHVIDYRHTDYAEEVVRRSDGQGVDVILDHIGADYLEPNLRCLAVEGRLVIIGIVSGAKADLHLGRLMVKRHRIFGSVLRARPIKEKAEIVEHFRKVVMPGFEDGRLSPLVHVCLPLEEVREAHRIMEESRHFGKIVLRT
jgi:putative PIG3 family NAD(P)H quinone oxidoreductase